MATALSVLFRDISQNLLDVLQVRLHSIPSIYSEPSSAQGEEVDDEENDR